MAHAASRPATSPDARARRLLVNLPDDAPSGAETAAPADERLTHALEMVTAERRRADALEAALEAANKGQEELRILLLRQSEQLALLLPTPREQPRAEQSDDSTATPDAASAPEKQRGRQRQRRWWRPWQL